MVIPFVYDLYFGLPAFTTFNAEKGLFTARKDGKMGIINAKGEVVVPFGSSE